MFVRTESLREFIRFYPLITFILLFQLVIFLATSLPFIPSREIFSLLAGVNLYIVEGELWRIVTPIFVHAGLAHLLFNSFSLVLFGPALERILGKGKFLFVYLLTGIAANIATLMLEPLTYTHVGSSGAIFGLFGFYIAITMFRKDLLSKENSQTILTIAVIGVVMTFFQANINITAHIFGLIAGFLTGRVILSK
ncbi:Membrane associated serine protease, rhomboid family [Mesobacillus persicus]|uniref:Membrane associated serine protease, rhomboid family n=1 Tax=Mesobacillus persicus TaxID=930146 RepID=A0A1H8KCT9_9BACI|nr:rhomboid family intramembrane serine protease [Mesobacillus persicus]SEN90567.1 Membrane associated serine protease, rhomboid family [Mesobacillus persicus]